MLARFARRDSPAEVKRAVTSIESRARQAIAEQAELRARAVRMGIEVELRHARHGKDP